MAPRTLRRAPAPRPAAKEIIKEGLSEYFIYTIEGTETIPNGWSKRMRSFEGRPCPSRSSIATGRSEYGEQLVRMYLADERQGLEARHHAAARRRWCVSFATTAATGSRTSRSKRSSTSPSGTRSSSTWAPIREVVFELDQAPRVARSDIWVKIDGTDTFKRVDGDKREVDESQLRRRLGRPRLSSISESATTPASRSTWKSAAAFPGHATFKASFEPQTTTSRPRSSSDGAARARADMFFELVTRQGRGAKQNNITIEKAEVK